MREIFTKLFRGLGLLLALASTALACRYNVREIGFVDAGQPGFRLAVFVHGEEQREWLVEFSRIGERVFAGSNISVQVLDETKDLAASDLAFRKQLGPRLPGAVLLGDNRPEGWPVFLHFTGHELESRLLALATSDTRSRLVSACIESYGAVLLLRSANDQTNAPARRLAQEAMAETTATLAELPKKIGEGPRLIECDPSLPEELPLAWSLGQNGRDLTEPVLAVIYGRGRLAGPALSGATLTSEALRQQLSIVGADCECVMDHSWMKAGSIPLTFTAADEARLPAALGFDPHSASVRAEVSSILANQSKVAADPSATQGGSGYRETPLEVVTFTPTATTVSPSLPKPRPLGRPLVIASILLLIGIAWWAIKGKK